MAYTAKHTDDCRPALFSAGRFWRSASMPRIQGPVVHSRSDQLGSRMRSKPISWGLHTCHCHQGMDNHIPPLLKKSVLDGLLHVHTYLKCYFVYLLLFMPKLKLLILLELKNIKDCHYVVSCIFLNN